MAVIAIVPPAQLASWSQAWHGRWMSELHLLVVYFSSLFQKGPPPRSGLGIRGTAVLGAESAGREGLGKYWGFSVPCLSTRSDLPVGRRTPVRQLINRGSLEVTIQVGCKSEQDCHCTAFSSCTAFSQCGTMIWAPGWFILLQGLSTAYAVMDVLSVTLKDRQSGRWRWRIFSLW